MGAAASVIVPAAAFVASKVFGGCSGGGRDAVIVPNLEEYLENQRKQFEEEKKRINEEMNRREAAAAADRARIEEERAQQLAAQQEQFERESAALRTEIERIRAMSEGEIAELQRQRESFAAEIRAMKEEKDRVRRDYMRIVAEAVRVVGGATKKVVLVVGETGAGKSTALKYLFEIEDAEPGEGENHVTQDLLLYSVDDPEASALPFDVVDTIGKMPDVRGIMRVISCAYNRGWDPAAIIVVHNGRNCTFENSATFLQVQAINTIRFEPNTFYRLIGDVGMDVQQALGITMFRDQNATPLSHVNDLVPCNIPGQVQESGITDALQESLPRLSADTIDFGTSDANDIAQSISNTLTFYMAKCIADRRAFNGSDLQFIDMQA